MKIHYNKELIIDYAQKWFTKPYTWCRDLDRDGYTTCIFLFHGPSKQKLNYCALINEYVDNNKSCCSNYDWTRLILEVL